MTDKIQVIIIVILIPVGLLFWYTNREHISVREIFYPGVPVMRIGEVPLRVEVAKTPEERERGLSGREDLGGLNGLLFIFDEAGYHTIWMKGMKFPIDIIWIGEDLTVVSINKNVSPDSYPRTFRPEKQARYAVETEVHYVNSMNIAVGQKVELPARYLEN